MIKLLFCISPIPEPMLPDGDSAVVRPEKDIARILQNIPKQSPNLSSCTSGDESSDHQRDIIASKPPGGGGFRRFQNRGIEG